MIVPDDGRGVGGGKGGDVILESGKRVCSRGNSGSLGGPGGRRDRHSLLARQHSADLSIDFHDRSRTGESERTQRTNGRRTKGERGTQPPRISAPRISNRAARAIYVPQGCLKERPRERCRRPLFPGRARLPRREANRVGAIIRNNCLLILLSDMILSLFGVVLPHRSIRMKSSRREETSSLRAILSRWSDEEDTLITTCGNGSRERYQ